MKIRILLPLNIFLFTFLATMSGSLHAEYYMVFGQTVEISGKAHPCVKKKKHKVYAKKTVKTVKHYYKPRNRARVDVFYMEYARPMPCACREVFIQGRWACYGGTAPPQRYYQYESYADYYPPSRRVKVTYNPDLTTGDDDTWFDPNMNIDR